MLQLMLLLFLFVLLCHCCCYFVWGVGKYWQGQVRQGGNDGSDVGGKDNGHQGRKLAEEDGFGNVRADMAEDEDSYIFLQNVIFFPKI